MRLLSAALVGVLLFTSSCRRPSLPIMDPTPYCTPVRTIAQSDPGRFERREADWRVGPVVYQVFVDRFVPPSDPASKAQYFELPRTFRHWDEMPAPGTRVPDLGCYSHELEFWGGDLAGVASRLDHVRAMGADVLYLNPVCRAYTNHKYDAQDWNDISPEYGTREDLRALARACHERGMKLMLDGVFNHMGRTAPAFLEARADPTSRYRAWFFFDETCRNGYRCWWNVPNLPEVNLDEPSLRAHLWESRDSVVRSYLRDGADGWRLDVAYDIGPETLSQITRASHEEKPGSAVIGEIANYPAGWMPALDGVMSFHLRQVLLNWLGGKLTGARAAALIDTAYADSGFENALRCWTFLDNHDTPRLSHSVPDPDLRRLGRLMQFTLPGAPCVYYGTEVEMPGGPDPANRAPMRWDLLTDDNPDLRWYRRLVGARRSLRALRVGDWAALRTESLLAFQRTTDRWVDTVVVAANATPEPVTELVAVRDGRLMNFGGLVDVFSGTEVKVHSGLLELHVPARSALVLVPRDEPGAEYSPYKRVR